MPNRLHPRPLARALLQTRTSWGRGFGQSQINSLLTPIDEADAMTLYRGETSGGGYHYTTDEAYAKSYSSSVASYRISRSGCRGLLNEGLIGEQSGINRTSTGEVKGPETVIFNEAVKSQILNQKQ